MLKYKEVTARTAGDAAEVAQALFDGKMIEVDSGSVWLPSGMAITINRTYRWQIDDNEQEDQLEVGGDAIHCKMKWKRLSQQKPDKLSDVLVYGGKYKHPYIDWAFYNSDGNFATHDGIDKSITHWMPLPDAPQDNIDDNEQENQPFEVGDDVMHCNMHAKIVSYRSDHPQSVVILYDDGEQNRVLKSSLRHAGLCPWTSEEVPEGWFIAKNDDEKWQRIALIGTCGVSLYRNESYVTLNDLLAHYEWSETHHGDRKPCGVWV